MDYLPPPQVDTLKLNFDGATSNDGLDIGFLVHTSSSSIVFVERRFICSHSISVVESYNLRWALLKLETTYSDGIWIGGDFILVISLLANKGSHPSNTYSLLLNVTTKLQLLFSNW